MCVCVFVFARVLCVAVLFVSVACCVLYCVVCVVCVLCVLSVFCCLLFCVCLCVVLCVLCIMYCMLCIVYSLNSLTLVLSGSLYLKCSFRDVQLYQIRNYFLIAKSL